MTKISAKTALALALGSLACLALAGCDEGDNVVFADDAPPAVPTGVYTITGDGQVEILWNPVRQHDVAGYGVYRNRTLTGPYTRIGEVTGVENTNFIDTFDIQNGRTYFYAVDAFDFAGHESELSYEDAFDTPRPASDRPLDVFALQVDSQRSGIDFSDYFDENFFLTAHDAADTDIFFQRIGAVLFAKGTVIGGQPNDIQDLGYTNSMDEVSWAPTQGWSVAPNGVELIVGHTYVVWTYDLFFAKFRVVNLLFNGGLPSGARIEWAYQIDPNNPELSPMFVTLREQPVPERGES
jgi:hypothetical protein